jgi:hypothetical protein
MRRSPQETHNGGLEGRVGAVRWPGQAAPECAATGTRPAEPRVRLAARYRKAGSRWSPSRGSLFTRPGVREIAGVRRGTSLMAPAVSASRYRSMGSPPSWRRSPSGWPPTSRTCSALAVS